MPKREIVEETMSNFNAYLKDFQHKFMAQFSREFDSQFSKMSNSPG